jgi:hypothetical protein
MSNKVVELLLGMRERFPYFGPKKLRVRLLQDYPQMRCPSASSIGALLKREGLIDTTTRRIRRQLSVAEKGPPRFPAILQLRLLTHSLHHRFGQHHPLVIEYVAQFILAGFVRGVKLQFQWAAGDIGIVAIRARSAAFGRKSDPVVRRHRTCCTDINARASFDACRHGQADGPILDFNRDGSDDSLST